MPSLALRSFYPVRFYHCFGAAQNMLSHFPKRTVSNPMRCVTEHTHMKN